MVEFYKYTHEEAIRQSIKQDRNAAGAIIASQDNDRIKVRIYFEYEVPAKYAKAVLTDHINEQSSKGGQHGADAIRKLKEDAQ